MYIFEKERMKELRRLTADLTASELVSRLCSLGTTQVRQCSNRGFVVFIQVQGNKVDLGDY